MAMAKAVAIGSWSWPWQWPWQSRSPLLLPKDGGMCRWNKMSVITNIFILKIIAPRNVSMYGFIFLNISVSFYIPALGLKQKLYDKILTIQHKISTQLLKCIVPSEEHTMVNLKGIAKAKQNLLSILFCMRYKVHLIILAINF